MEPENETLLNVESPPLRRLAKLPLKIIFALIIILLITTLNVFNGNLSKIPKLAASAIYNSNLAKFVSKTGTNSTTEPPSPIIVNSTYYELIKDANYHYEFRFEYNRDYKTDAPRLMILLNGSVRTCTDYWQFAVGRRILYILHSFHYSILVICNKKKTYDLEGPAQHNKDAKWIYTYLQTWMNEVYYKQFQRYPRLYIHGISRGSRIAATLSRILPIQQQIFTIHPSDFHSMLTRSDYPLDLQNRLQLDSVFANWFYFDLCYKPTLYNQTISEFCPYQSGKYYYQPVPPTYYVHVKNDRLYELSQYTSMVEHIRNDSFALGGKLLNSTEGVKLYIMNPLNATPTYMQKTFDVWYSKPHASAIFYEHYANRSFYNATNKTRETCNCLPTDFRYYELYPNITQTWPKQKQDDYKDYLNDVQNHLWSFCEDFCGDLHADHAMLSRDLDKALEWVKRMDTLRKSLLVEDYLSRPLRIWMYNKTSVITNDTYFASNRPDFVNITRQYDMYSPEYYLQDYFNRLQASTNFSARHLQWADNPLLADYFIIPSDLSFYYFAPDVNRMTYVNFQALVQRLNTVYCETLLTNIQTKFPYWTMAKHADQHGSNHILTIVTGRNIGLLSNDTQKKLKNVIQIVFTGIRIDMLPPDSPPPRDYRGMLIVYRHGYDMVIPQFTRLVPNSSRSLNITQLVKKKNRLLFFAGALEHTMTPQSARPLLQILLKDLNETQKTNITSKVGGKRYETLAVIRGHQKPEEYIASIRSTVFSLCPEGFFPWSPRFYDAIQLGAIPLVLADNIVLPFERFVDWPSISAKINVSNIRNMIDPIERIDDLEKYTIKKLTNAKKYADAFRWPYSGVGENGHKAHDFLPDEDQNGTAKNAFHYVSLELRCRRLEQLYGLTSDSFSSKSIDARQKACTAHSSICPCYSQNRSLAFRQYL